MLSRTKMYRVTSWPNRGGICLISRTQAERRSLLQKTLLFCRTAQMALFGRQPRVTKPNQNKQSLNSQQKNYKMILNIPIMGDRSLFSRGEQNFQEGAYYLPKNTRKIHSFCRNTYYIWAVHVRFGGQEPSLTPSPDAHEPKYYCNKV